MSTDGQEPENTVDDAENLDGEAEVSSLVNNPKALAAELARVRRENAKVRTQNREAQERLKKMDDWEASQLSELDRVKAERAQLATRLEAIEREKLQASVARAAKLDPDLADRVKGETEEEMLADAKRLAAKYPHDASASSMFAGQRGRAVGAGKDETEADWFRSQFQ